ncbi:minichromosome maintenance protein MCM [Stygiolobus caldivivus]|uniref:DNA helicase n=1 Tax=Stygiolobus caldivivus TaxID=2824673 RepID=A0A8D5U841_9CREN|nr:minichromosome maintenance protein MCM [Stygiolobus caldivivus]BCU70494.1 minichromosome maintenance protein MCM [Stygiolobus caldivivus]
METKQIDYGELFIEFITTFKDNRGRLSYLNQINEIIAYRRKSFYVNFADLFSFNQNLATVLINSPKDIVPILEKKVYDYIIEKDPEYQYEISNIHLRILNIPRTVELRKIRSNEIGKLISVEGILVKSTPVKERLSKAVYQHISPDCMQEFYWPPDEEDMGEIIELPSSCPMCGKAGQFKLIEDKSTFVDYQKAVLQERPEEIPPGQLPRQLEVVFEDDLVDVARPGDRVKIVGILEIKKDSQVKRGSKSVFDFYLKVNSIEISQKVLDEVRISEEDEKKIKDLAKDPWIREKIISSIAPSIYGHWEIKEAIALSLFGGVSKILADGTRIRGDIHVLIIGDPGTAKSQILQFASRVAPRAVYTTGKGSTAAGLTATVTRDKNSGDFYLEAGALVLADGGVAVIDEIDKMRDDDRVAIHEAMEQQTVSIAKAGIVAKLNARATVIAAGNPKLGRYIKERGISENINLPPTILSRFDLIFILIDNPGDSDVYLASHILNVHGNRTTDQNAIEIDLLKKYIAYAKKNVFPKLSEEAKQLLQDFFVEMRRKSVETADSPIIITPRQLEALIRISEAYAKMALKGEVTKEDAERAINIMRIFLENVGLDVESGKIDIDTIMTGKPKSAREKMAKILEIIDTLSLNECAKVKDIVKEGERIGIDKQSIEKLLTDMRRQGLIYESKPECYKKV